MANVGTLIDAAPLVQFKDSAGIDVRLACTRFHFDVEQSVKRQVLYLVRQHIVAHLLPVSLLHYPGIQTCCIQRIFVEIPLQQRVLMIFLGRLLNGSLHHSSHPLYRNRLMSQIIFKF